MIHIYKCCRIVLMLVLLLLPAALGQTAPEVMAVDQIKTGMLGIARTVVTGTKVEEFGIEVLGVMRNKGPAGDLILVRASGDLIERSGGIAEGMSGSPVYIDGKLVGAIAYGWPFADHNVGMVTPIGDMLKLLAMPTAVSRTTDAEPAAAAAGPDQDPRPNQDPGLVSEVTPLMATGFSGQALALLTDKLRPFNLVPYAVGEVPGDATLGPVEPGSAVGVQLVRGDVNLGVLGTATYVAGNKVLAFGHPFLKRGISNYFLTEAYVFTTVKGQQSSFKVGTSGEAIGMVSQDRGAGIVGEIGQFPNIIPLRVIVRDETLGISQDAEAQVVQDEQLAPTLVAATVLNIIEKTADRTGAGTTRVEFELSGCNIPGGIFKRDNMFYSPAQFGEMTISEIYELMTLLASNQFQTVNIMDLKVNVSVSAERRTAAIMSARANVAAVQPGETIEVTVDLKPYRGANITRKVPFTIPKDQLPGPLLLEVRGGGIVPLSLLLGRQPGADGNSLRFANQQKAQNFDDLLKDLVDRDRNNDLVVEAVDLIGNLPPTAAPAKAAPLKLDDENKDESNAGVDAARLNPGGRVAGADQKGRPSSKGRLATDFIIDSDTQVIINVTGPKGKR